MTNNKRITLRPAKAAVYLGCSTATLWRWNQTLPDFPQPHKVPGQRITYWYKDELDAWVAQNGKPVQGKPSQHYRERAQQSEAERELLDHAIAISEAAGGGVSAQPYVAAYLLVGEGTDSLTAETGITGNRLHQLLDPATCPTDEEIAELFRVAAARVVYRERELAERLTEAPELRHREKFRSAVMNLNKAHELCFGRALLDYLLREDRDDGTA